MGAREGHRLSRLHGKRAKPIAGFTMIELIIAMVIITILAAMAIPLYAQYVERAKVVVCVTELKSMVQLIESFKYDKGRLPTNLAEIGWSKNDPWTKSYNYLDISNGKNQAMSRKDRHLVPINSEYDLYSMGKDGQSKPRLTKAVSQDDIIVANNGNYIGLAAAF